MSGSYVERFVRSAGGVRLYTQDYGDGPQTLVLCDGIGCDGFIWRYFQPYFSSYYRVVHWHYRGHGLSDVPPLSAMNVQNCVTDLVTICEALDVERPVLCGHSMGVQLILAAALEYPQLARGLVLLCGSYGRPLDTFRDTDLLGLAFPRLRKIIQLFPNASQRVWSRALHATLTHDLAYWLEVNHQVARRGDMVPYFDHMGSMNIEVFATMLASLSSHTVEEDLGEITAPTLVVGGERDLFTPAWLSRRMARRLPRGELLEVAGGSHVTPIEFPDLVHLRVGSFLRRVFG